MRGEWIGEGAAGWGEEGRWEGARGSFGPAGVGSEEVERRVGFRRLGWGFGDGCCEAGLRVAGAPVAAKGRARVEVGGALQEDRYSGLGGEAWRWWSLGGQPCPQASPEQHRA